MSVLYSIVPTEHVFFEETTPLLRDEVMYEGLLVEVVYDAENIVLNRIINGPLDCYLQAKYTPGTIIGKRYR